MEEHDLGAHFVAETGFQIRRDPDTTKARDWAFVEWARLPERPLKGFVPIVPTLVLETRSPGDSGREIQEKIDEWLEAGVRVVLDQDPATRTVFVHRPGQEPERFGSDDTLVLEDIFPGFSAPVERLFPSQ